MARPKPKLPTHLAVVWWLDAHFHSDEVDRAAPQKAYKKITAGFLIQDDSFGTGLAQDINEDGSAEAVTFIPRGNESRVLRWKIPK